VQAHAARLQSAKTDLLPRFGRQFLGGDAELHFAGLPSIGATGGLVGLSAYLPVFNCGQIRANIAATDNGTSHRHRAALSSTRRRMVMRCPV
jgi:outer membrane protein TolC